MSSVVEKLRDAISVAHFPPAPLATPLYYTPPNLAGKHFAKAPHRITPIMKPIYRGCNEAESHVAFRETHVAI